MSQCNRIATCPFFNEKLPVMPLVKNMLKNDYCRSNSSICARHILSETLGDSHVPEDLFPNRYDKAEDIMLQYKHVATLS